MTTTKGLSLPLATIGIGCVSVEHRRVAVVVLRLRLFCECVARYYYNFGIYFITFIAIAFVFA